MPDSKLTFREVNFKIDDDLTHCTVRWDCDDHILCGYGAKRSFPKTTKVSEILQILITIGMHILTDDAWTILR